MNAISSRTGIKIPDVDRLLEIAIYYDWVTKSLRLTDEGYLQLSYLKKAKRVREGIPKRVDFNYYPTSLRAPVKPI